MKKILLPLLLALFMIACEPEEIDEVIDVSETPYIVFEAINRDGDPEFLVPVGHVMYVGDVESVIFEYEVALYSVDAQRGLMNVEALDILIDGQEEYAHLIQITVMDEIGEKLIPVFNYAITVKVTVELLEPIDEAEAIANELDLSLVNVEDAQAAFEAITGKEITFSIGFTLIST